MRRLFNGFLPDRSSSTNSKPTNSTLPIGSAGNIKFDNAPVMIHNSCIRLSDTIQDILNNTGELSGDNITGFERLLTIITKDVRLETATDILRSNGEGCFTILISNMNHPLFIETCTKNSLPTTLMNVLRLLRMYEIKRCKTDVRSEKGSTVDACHRVCQVFQFLFNDPCTTEQIRQALVKLLTFPLSVLPAHALHLQQQSVRIITSMCRTGFTSQQVWFLHDVQAVTHMIRHLNELAQMKNESRDQLLRGEAAEKSGMWLNGCTCIVELVSSSTNVSSVLLNDLEAAGGVQLFINMLKYSAPDRFMKLLNIITRLVFDPMKTEQEHIPSPIVGLVIIDLIRWLYDLQNDISETDNVERLLATISTISTRKRFIESRIYMIQAFCYSLLTIYSNDQLTCNVLEEGYHFLPLLLLVIPTVSSDAVTAVLTVLSYVCQCAENIATFPLIAFCASFTAIINEALSRKLTHEYRLKSMEQIELLLNAFDTIVRSNTKYCTMLLGCGFLQYIVCQPLEELYKNCKNDEYIIEDIELNLYEKLLTMLLLVNSKSPFVADKLMVSGVPQLLQQLLMKPSVTSEFTKVLLTLSEDLARSNTSHLEESMKLILDTLVQIGAGQFEKKRRILDSLSKIVAESHEASTICISLDAFDRILTTIEEMKDLFLTTNSATADSSSSASSNCSNDHQMLLRCLESGMRLLALMFCLSTTQVNEAVDNLTAMRFQKHYLRLATALIASGIYNTPFWSKCNDYLFGLLNGFTESTAILNAKITETMIVLMQQIPDESAVDIANRLLFFVNINPSNQKILSEAGVVSQLVLAFHRELLVDSNSLVAKVLELIKILTYSYLTIEGFITIFMYIVRPVVQNKEANYNSLKMPWICRDQSMAHTSWDAIQYVVDLAARTAEKDDSVPHLVLGTKSSANNAPTCLAITLNETTKPFPHSAFSFACWFKIGLEMNCATNNDWVAPLKGIIPILSICSPANDCFFEGQLDVDNSLIRIAVIRNGNGLSTIRFKLVHTLKTNDWNSIVINFKKSKRFTGVNKSTVSVYINGIQAIPETTDTLDVPYTSSSANFYVGKLFIKSLSSFSLYDISQGDDKLMSNLTSAESWKLGPCSLYDDILSAAQIATVFMKGPKYIGSYQAESSLMDNLPTLSTLLLQRCNSGGDTADAIMDLLGLRGLELVVDPYIEGMSLESAAKFEFPMLPQSVFLYTCNSVADNVAEGADSYTLVGIPPLQRSNTLQIDTDAVLKQQKQLMLLNRSTLDSITPIAVVENGFSDYCSSSFADCITCAGGPALLLPLLQMASTSEQILTTISLVRSTIYLHASNVLYMKTIGYKLMAFILSLKGSDLITPDVLEAMKTLACSRWKNSDGMSPSTDGLLLVDTCAFYYLYLNHQFWSPLRYDLALASLTGLFQLSNDEKYSALNSTRLSLLGVSRWTLMLVLFGIKKCTDQPKESKSEKVLELINPSSTQENGSQSSMYDSRHDVSIENDSYAWKMVTPSYAAMADFRDPHEPAIHLATEIVQKVITAKLRQSDIELIARIISYSFIPLYNATCINAAILDAEEVIIDVDAEKEYPFCDFESQEKEASSANHNRMKPMEVFRIQLLRLLTTLYSIHTVEPHFKKNRNRPETSTRKSAVGDSEGLIIFRSTLTPEWFLCVLEKPNDVATFSAILRLLGLMIQRDIKFFKDFCAEDGMKILCRIIITNAQPLPVVLPLLALLFRIPMQMLSHPSQIRSVAKFVQLLELEECAGPDLIDPVAGEQTIPILATTLECLANSVRLVNSAVGPEKVAAKRVVDIVFGILQYGIIKSVSFKQLMQQKTPIELLSYAVLVCSTAYNDFGSQIYTTTNEAVDLSSSIQEDYISASGEFSPKSSDATDSLEKQRMDRSNSGQSVSSNSATSPGRTNVRTIAIVDHHNADRLEVKMLSEDAERLLHFVSLIMCQSTTEFMNPSVLSFFFVSYPKSFLASYEFGYQKLILEQFHKVLVQLTKKTMDTGSLHSICDMITCLLPLSRTEVLYESIQFDIFKALLDLYTRSAGSALTTLKQAKELGNTTRFFAIACILMWSSPTRSDSKNFRLSVLCAIKININYLLNSHLEDALECPSSSIHGSGRFLTNRVEYDHAATTNGTAEAFHGFNGQTKKIVNGMNLNFIKAERNRIASMFVQFMLNTCYSLVFDDDNAVRIEATRVMSSLAINRKGFLEPILSNRPANNRNLYASNKVVNKKSSFDSNTIDDEGKAEFDVFKDGILKLVPSSIVDKDLFSRAGVNKDGSAKGDSEGSRFADFYYCVSQNHSKCDKAFTVVESNVREISPSSNEIDEIFRLYEVNHVKESILDTLTAADVVDAMQRAENGQKQGEKVLKALYRWKNSYIIHLANGSILWRRAWTSLQTSSTWGYEPIKDPKIEREMLENAIIPLIKDREVDDDSPINYVEYSDKFIDENILGSKAMLGFCLDPLEGPERMRRKLEQDISGSGKSLLSRDAYMLSPKKKSSISKIDETFVADAERAFSPEPTADHEDMEEFLMKVSKRGIIKRVSISGENAFTDATTGLDDSMYVSSLSGNMLNDNENDHQNEDDDDDTVQNTNEDHDAVPNAEDSFRMDFDDNRGKLLRGFSQQDPVVVLSAKESYGVDEEPLTKNTSFNDNHILKGPEEDTKVEGEVVNSGRSQILEDVIKGIIGISDWNEGKLYNVKRIYGLEAQTALLVLSPRNVHILSGFTCNLHPHSDRRELILTWDKPMQNEFVTVTEEKPALVFPGSSDWGEAWINDIWYEFLTSDLAYVKTPLNEIYSFFKRRHELKYTAMEITDVKGYTMLFSCQTAKEMEEILTKLVESDLPASIFNAVVGMKNIQLLRGASNLYNRLVSIFLQSLTTSWQNGEMSNFEYLMHINAAAGRSFLDLTQYPVFPWILRDYSSEDIDLSDPAIYRDLSKPMGALGEKRAQQYRDRFQTMDEFYKEQIEGSPPPFYYGTHYSCAGYVLHYLIRLQPYSKMAVLLQGGSFDKADRLFLSIESSWRSASQDNLQDVRELIPEFFYLPEFLVNLNNLDFGKTQREEIVNDVVLPKWAKNDPREFVRIHRAALESKFVTENLHNWIDLIFGYKQRGQPAIDSLNVFIHLTYEGEVDIDAITDSVMKIATISQINNFGQTPSKLFSKPHPRKIIPNLTKKISDVTHIDLTAISFFTAQTPPLSVIGAEKWNLLTKISYQQVSYAGGLKGVAVGDIRLTSRDRLIATPVDCAILLPQAKVSIRYGSVDGSLHFHVLPSTAPRTLEQEKDVTLHENLHQKRITCVSVSKNGDLIVTGSEDTSVRFWRIGKAHHQRKLYPICTFFGHTRGVTCIDLCVEFSLCASGSKDKNVMVWDCRTHRLIRVLRYHNGPVISVSINSLTGWIATLTELQVRLYHINGDLLSYFNMANLRISLPTVVYATPCSDWQDGVVMITGHRNGHLLLWKMCHYDGVLAANSIDAADVSSKVLQNAVSDEHTSALSLLSPEEGNSSRKISSAESNSPLFNNNTNISIKRQLYVAYTPTRTHKANITVIKLCAVAPSALTRGKEIITRSSDHVRSLDLFVGDAAGYISRWTPLKLDQLPPNELVSILKSDK